MDLGNLLANGVGGIFGGGALVAIFKFFSDRSRTNMERELGLRTADTSDEASATTGYAALMTTLLEQVKSQDGRIKNLEEAFGVQRTGRLFAEEQNALRDIYIARLEARLDPPHPEKPHGFI